MDKKIHTTNYFNTLIEPAEDCPVAQSEIPPAGEKPGVARQQYELLAMNPYKYTSDEVLFSIYSQRNDIVENELPSAKELYFSKGQACLRASPLVKRYGWAVHFNAEGKVAIIDTSSILYDELRSDNKIKKVKGMRSKRAL